MLGRDPVLPLNTLLGPKVRCLGNDINIHSLEAMKNMFEIATTNLKIAQERGDPRKICYPINCSQEIQYWYKIISRYPLILNI